MKAKVLNIAIEGNGFYLGMEKGCFIIKDKHGRVERIPLFENEIGEITISSGNFISTSVLACCGFWNIPIIIKTRNGKPVAILRSLDDDSHVKTRIAQYQAHEKGKGVEIAKTIVLSKIEGQNMVLRKHGLKEISLEEVKERIKAIEAKSLREARYRLNQIEGKASKHYFKQIFSLLPFRVEERKGWKAYDGVNNTFNLAYTLLKFRVYSAILNAHLEPYLGFLHSEQLGKPSLVCDLMELYRYLVDDYIIEFSQTLKQKDFTVKTERYSTNRIGKREVLSREKTREFVKGLNRLFQTKVNIPRIKHGNKQTIETLMNEEAYLLAKHLRNETSSWKPRIVVL
ncbi:MAG: CRISPR-associated endonuclease Cas1 [Candidatus Bathyarchaeia archaeon]